MHENLTRLDVVGPALARARDDPGWERLEATLVSGGKSNLTFELSSDAGEAVGAATASPMEGQNADVTAPFLERGYELSKLFYFGESVLKRDYRGRGIGHRFFDEREAVARAAPGVELAT